MKFNEQLALDRGGTHEEIVHTAESISNLPLRQEDPVSGDFIGKLILSLILLLVGCFVVLKLIRKRLPIGGFVSSSNSIEIVEAKRLSAKTAIYLLSINGKNILVSESSVQIAFSEGHPPGNDLIDDNES